jgi:molybdate transport system ATP-binding protein
MIEIDARLVQGGFTLDVSTRAEARAIALIGPSGSGKTTLLEAIAGLRTPDRGRIVVGGHVLFSAADRIDLPPRLRRVGYVPQDGALFPHMDVRRNVLYGAHGGRALPMDRIASMLEIAPLLGRHVRDLSGGERQRVALARALMSGPDLLLMDEPLASIDPALRRRILPYLRRVRDELGVPLIYVSHNAEEVEAVADRVIALEQGHVVRSPAS